MEDAPSTPASAPRPPTQRDLGTLCLELNRLGAKYLVTGSFALVHHGCDRPVEEVSLLIAGSPENQVLILEALEILPDKASRELRDVDLREGGPVCVADEIPVELHTTSGGLTFEDASGDIEWQEHEGVRIPFASKKLLWWTKQTHDEKDELDRAFLRTELHGILPEEVLHPSPLTEGTSEGFLGQLWKKFY